MFTNFYKPSTWLTGARLRRQLLTLASALLMLAPAALAQAPIDVPAGNPNVAAGRRPLATWYGWLRAHRFDLHRR